MEQPVTPDPAAPPAPETRELDFPPVANGVDYLVSVVDHLAADAPPVVPRNLKFAVIHLHAATEVLLKARLLSEHWSLVFKDPLQATADRYHAGDFESCGIDETIERLANLASVSISDNDHHTLRSLAKDRNALQHYGLTHNAYAIEARAGQVLDFLVRFLDETLLPELSPEESTRIAPDMEQVLDGLDSIQAYVTQRMKRLRGTLRGHESRTVNCVDCRQMAMVVSPEEDDAAWIAQCHFCGLSELGPRFLANAYVYGHPDAAQMVHNCPRCQSPTFTDGVILADGRLVSFCFLCTATSD
ncbi:hypothetical protein E2C00_00620 [Streptomyces sp. WAC05374]|uniref:hypothetical protein n=1 Tax=Streptomyces sp. WAC05374 TaxID=2487420 RepID=UPI000F896173|nr:hypothetical protein [Streptomyces sp. WAC05374]RST19590.1 hypothetical protein EF905_00325 [Streptomyces sp. WAC05374]TDF50073.1 hypothetical protein E2B92_00595 [Streptomyces sp. WAC05374]TDF57799.1 hypothetical protein E2C02_08385 [Streptomyces sp. WAC05374]TDF60327.1 hypothetical protein E2C00_00620 [Streptomyces sp. WAC05374]